MSNAHTAGIVPALVLALGGSTTLGAQPACGAHAELMRCRGGPTMDRGAVGADTDLSLYVRGTRADTVLRGAPLEAGACTWATRPFAVGASGVVVFPLNGPLAIAPHAIGHQARACARDSSCFMEFCAFPMGRELGVVDGYLRLTFAGRD